MDKETIEKKKAAVSKKFDDLKAQRESIDTEMVRLQGEYRALDELLTTDSTKEKGNNGK